MIELTHEDVYQRLLSIYGALSDGRLGDLARRRVLVYGIPRGGVAPAYALAGMFPYGQVVEGIEVADVVVDDIVDSGRTRAWAEEQMKDGAHFVALCNKGEFDSWVQFPWERTLHGMNTGAEDIPVRLLQYIGEDPGRGGLQETPQRFLSAWQHWAGGYKQDPERVLKVFEDGAERYDGMVIVKDIPVYSHCEHHLAPFFGVAHVGYIPAQRIVGLSKLSRVVDIYAQRLQVQERLTRQVADTLQKHLRPKGIAVVMECRHLCMESRGIARQGSTTITDTFRGALFETAARAEFMSRIKP